MAVLENAANPHCEGLAAGVTLPKARTATFAAQATDSLVVAVAAVRANRAFGPKVGLNEGEGGFLVVEVGGGKDRMCHGNLL
jgi:hypothetical protein